MSSSTTVDPHEVYLAAAHAITRCIDLWCDVDKVIKTVQLIQQDTASKHGKLDEDNAARGVHEESLRRLSSESKEHTTRTYYKIIQIVPSLKAIVDDPLKSTELMVISSKMNAMIRSTRSNNTTRLKTYIPQYAAPNPFKVAFNPSIVSSNGRAEMGLNHPILTRWLCPADQLQRFDEDPIQAVKDLASGVISMGAEDFSGVDQCLEMIVIQTICFTVSLRVTSLCALADIFS
ncbi:hypothetical protein F5I97DRAFT_1991406 [Phlebopus sp. FC_14]|nr:hypothetical protein F5I97DRAFT_1991406 [Phlebopus sp. FC_14]